jgi:hypothetical protein
MKINELISDDELLDESILSTMFGGIAKSAARGARRANIALRRMTRTRPPTAAERQFKRDLAELKKLFKNITPAVSALISGLKLYGLATPFMDYYNNMANAKEALQMGQMTQADYEQTDREQTGELITTVAAGIVGSGIIRTASILTQVVRLVPKIGSPIGDLILSATPAVQAAYLNILASKEGQLTLAKFLTVPVIEGTGGAANWALKQMTSLYELAKETAEKAGTALDNHMNGKTDAAPTTPAVEPPNLKDFKKSSTAPATQATGAAAGSTTPSGKEGEYVSDMFYRDPETGQLKMRI